jgi:putative glutamine amidotransferase
MITIGITQRIFVNDATGERRDCLAKDWYKFLVELGFNWIALPNDPDIILNYIKINMVNSFILTGGDNIGVFIERDNTESILLDWSMKNSIPTIGVCRGFQFISHWLGEELNIVDNKLHVNNRHKVIFSNSSRDVNSFHNFAPVITNKLTPIAYCPVDNSVEAACSWPFLGLSWHPEREPSPQIDDLNIFRNHFTGQNK